MNRAKYLGFSTWRLPTTPQPDSTCSTQDVNNHISFNYSCTGSEMGHLFYVELGGAVGSAIASAHNSNYSFFTNFTDFHYWSGTTYSVDPGGAWTFFFGNGSQVADNKAGVDAVLPVLSGDVAASQVLPQFVFGGGWYSALYFTNTGAAPVSFPVNFISDTGTPLNVPSVGGASATVSLAARGTAIIEALNIGSLNQGYVSLSLPVGVESYGVFRQSVPGTPDQEAVVPISSAFSTASTLIFDETNFTTSVAIVNPSPVPTTVTITVRNANGVAIGTSTVALPANSHTAMTLRSLPGLGAIPGNRGSADFSVTSGNVAVLGLRFGGAAFTSIPTKER